MTVNEEFGAKLRELRKAAGLTLRELAQRVDVNFSYLSKIETGALPPPSEKVVRRLARALNFDQDELLTLAGIIPADIAEILKDRKTRQRLRAEQARKDSRATHHSAASLSRVAVPWKGLYRLALPVFLVMAVAFSIWFASPTQALTIEYPNQPSSGVLGGSYTFYVQVSIEDTEHLPLQSIDIVIYNVASPTTYKATLAGMPLGDSSTAAHNPTEGPGSGTAVVSASADAAWGYSYSAGYVNFGGTGYTFTPSPSGGYGYQGGTGTTSITYTIRWTSPSGWPAGSYKIRTVLTTSPQSPGGGTTFTKTSAAFTLTSPTSAGSGGGSAIVRPGTTYVSDIVTSSGTFIQQVTAISGDGKVKLTIDKGVTGKNINGQPLRQISITPATTAVAPPTDGSIVGLMYDLGPNGATFDPPVTLTFTYDPAGLPAGTNEANLSLAYYDITTNTWVVLEGITVDTSNHTVSGLVSHFTNFAVIAGTRPAAFTVNNLVVAPAKIEVGATATVTATISNTGDLSGSFDAVLRINDSIVETKKVTLSGQSSEKVSFTVAPKAAGTYSIGIDGLSASLEVSALPVATTPTPTSTIPAPPTTTPIPPPTTSPAPTTTTAPPPTTTTPVPQPTPSTNWWLIGGIAAVIIVIAVVAWQLVSRRAH